MSTVSEKPGISCFCRDIYRDEWYFCSIFLVEPGQMVGMMACRPIWVEFCVIVGVILKIYHALSAVRNPHLEILAKPLAWVVPTFAESFTKLSKQLQQANNAIRMSSYPRYIIDQISLQQVFCLSITLRIYVSPSLLPQSMTLEVKQGGSCY